MTQPVLKSTLVVLLAVVAGVSAGCQTTSRCAQSIALDKVALHAWRLRSDCYGHESKDFKLGFLDGYIGAIEQGGDICDPIAPPSRYWSLTGCHNRGCGPVADYYNGWAHGVTTSMQDGAASAGQVPLRRRPQAPPVSPAMYGAADRLPIIAPLPADADTRVPPPSLLPPPEDADESDEDDTDDDDNTEEADDDDDDDLYFLPRRDADDKSDDADDATEDDDADDALDADLDKPTVPAVPALEDDDVVQFDLPTPVDAAGWMTTDRGVVQTAYEVPQDVTSESTLDWQSSAQPESTETVDLGDLGDVSDLGGDLGDDLRGDLGGDAVVPAGWTVPQSAGADPATIQIDAF